MSINITGQISIKNVNLSAAGGPTPPPPTPVPVPNFTANTTSGNSPLTVAFTDTSTNSPTGWAWDFTNDGSTDSTVQNPTYTYSSPGTYSVKLTATNANGSANTVKTNFITVIQNYSNLFDGSNYLSVADNAAFNVSTGNWTYEAWIYPTGSVGAAGVTFVSKSTSGSFGPVSVGFQGTGGPSGETLIGLCSTSGNDWEIATVTNITWASLKNKWSHVAFVRNGSTFTLYLNGASVSSTSSGASLVQNNEPVLIGVTNYPPVPTNFAGYISNLRIVKGTAVYTSNFSVPTSPLTNISGTSLLTCQSATIVDNSSNAFAITNNNGVTVNSLNPFN